jgi:hypothetical protein
MAKSIVEHSFAMCIKKENLDEEFDNVLSFIEFCNEKNYLPT